MRSMELRVAFVLTLSIGMIAQSPSATTTQTNGDGNSSNNSSQVEIKGQNVPPAASPPAPEAPQTRKHAHAVSPERNHTPSAAGTPNTTTAPAAGEPRSAFSSIARQPVERWIQIYIALTGVLALIALGALGVMRRQLQEMKEARRQTDALIKRAIEQSSAMREAAEQTDRLIEQAIEQANHAAEQAKAASMAACAAKTSSENFADVAHSSVQSIQVAQQAMHLEQRAWLFVTETRASQLQVGQPLSITVGFKNTGRTPAKNVQIAAHLEPLPRGQAPEPKLEKTQSRGVIPPNGTVFSTISTGRKHAEGVTEQGLKAITCGELVIWIYGTVTYEDIFQNRQATMFCYMLHPDGKTFVAAEVYNDAT